MHEKTEITLTRREAIKEQAAQFGNLELPTICLALRAGVNGMDDPMDEKRVRKALVMLQMRLDTWEPSYNKSERLDSAVKEMVAATIEEVRSYL